MKKILKDDFTTGNNPNTMSEFLILGKYLAARTAFTDYAKIANNTIIDEELSNVYMQMCRRKIGNFSYGFDHNMTADKATFHSRLEAFEGSYSYFGEYNKFGNLKIELTGSNELVKIVTDAWNNGKPTSWDEINPVIDKYFKNKEHCYGLCQDED